MRVCHPVNLLGVGLVVGACTSGCANSADQVIAPVVLGMVETQAPTYEDDNLKIYETYSQVALPLRKPSDDERPKDQTDPYPRTPFHRASDTRITARFTLSNLDDQPHTIELLINPWNEFVRYFPGRIVPGATTPNFSGIDRFVILSPLGRVEGIITPDDVVEMATDLATAMQLTKTPPGQDTQFGGAALYNRAFNQQNRSSVPDPVLAPYIPPVVANITGFDLGLRSYEAVRVAVEVVLDIEDIEGDRVIPDGDSAKKQGRPAAVLSPPATAMQ